MERERGHLWLGAWSLGGGGAALWLGGPRLWRELLALGRGCWEAAGRAGPQTGIEQAAALLSQGAGLLGRGVGALALGVALGLLAGAWLRRFFAVE